MNKKNCLTDQDLLLHHYGELDEDDAIRHLSKCEACEKRLTTLSDELAQLPVPDCTPDDLAGMRMAARLSEKIMQPKRKMWLPTIGATAAATLALVITFTGSPPQNVEQAIQAQPSPMTTIDFGEDMPDIEFLEEMDLLQDFELLAEIEGV